MNKTRRTIIATLCAIGLAIFIFPFNIFKEEKARDYDEIASENVIRIVTSYDPVGLYVSSDTIAGFNSDLLKALQQYTPIRFEIVVENSLDKSLEGLATGKYDLIARSLPITSSLSDTFRFTLPVVQNKLVLIQRKQEFNDNVEVIRNRLDLANKIIHIPVNSPIIVRLNNLSNEIGDTIHIVENNIYQTHQLAMMVASKDINFTVSDAQTAKKLASKIPEIDIDTDIGFTHFEGWVVRSSSPMLLDSINLWLEEFKATPEYKKIYKKYYKTK